VTGEPADQADEQPERLPINVYDLAATAHDLYTAHLHSPTTTPDAITTALRHAAQAMAATFTARREAACLEALVDGTQGVLADATGARMDPRVPAGQLWQLPYSVTLADVDAGALDPHLKFLHEQLTRPVPPSTDEQA
jgi:hypothetical protein